ncbi:MAG: Bug family tripartite tricarboxylate transporter substrate binding protein [Xanthobacteraceae bacterium]
MFKPRVLVITAMAFGIWASSAVSVGAQSFPSRPIRLIVPFPAGGPADVMGRLIAQELSTRIGPTVVENRPGAGSTLGAKSVATADPDGYTLLLGSSASLAIGPALYRNAGYDPLTGFVPVAMVSNVPYVMVSRVTAPFTTISGLLAYAKANPGKLNFGVPNGAPPHMLALLFRQLTGVDVTVVPYKGAATAITDLIGGQIDGGFETTSVMFAHLHEGKVRGLAVVTERRLPQLPEVPTMIESGVPELVGSSWTGIMAPAGTPAEIVRTLRSAVVAAVESEAIKDKFAKLGAEARLLTQDEFARFIAAEAQRLEAIVRRSGTQGE